MNYKETIDYLFNVTPMFEKVGATAYKEGLYNTLALDKHFGHPWQKYKTIHVAGTNGKGSCSHSLAAILQQDGYKVGLYTSPHLYDFRERMRVNGQCVSEQYVIDFVERERPFFEPLHPSFFELTTAMAFKYFAEQEVDVAVIEVGLGGRLDCTNIIRPEVSVITNISFDHTQFLGHTLAEIAGEKAGIIKDGVPVVVGEDCEDTRPVFERVACERRAPIVFAEDSNEIVSAETCSVGVKYQTKHYGDICADLSGFYQIRNMNTILHVVSILKRQGLIHKEESVTSGLSRVCSLTGLVGRWQQIQTNPRVVCDTGHNVGGWKYLSKQLVAQSYAHLRVVFGMVDDKDIDKVMTMLPPEAVYYFTRPESKRAIPAEVVAEKGCAHGLQGQWFPTVAEAYTKAMADAMADDFVFVGGSSYVVADLFTFLRH